MNNRTELKKFDGKEHYRTGIDSKFKDEKKGFYVELYQEGKELINQYYANKYNTNVAFVKSLQEIADNKDIQHAREKKLEIYRKAFIVGGNTHSELILYLKENNKECFIYADSVNFNRNKNALNLYDLTKIPLYVVDNIRQKDEYSCHTDALIMSRDFTAKDVKSNNYQFKELFSKIETRSTKKSKLIFNKDKYKDALIYEAILPDFTLKTAQTTKFIFKHKEKSHPIVHGNEHLIQFINRYHEQLMIINKDKKSHGPKKVARYLILKGRKYADIIEIQFYLEQLKNIFSKNWSNEQSLEFIKTAKVTLRSQGQIGEREGLHTFVEKFIEDFQEKLSKVDETNTLKLQS